MSPYLLPGLILDALVALCCYLSSDNLWISIAVFAAYVAVTLCLLIPMLNRFSETKRRSHEAFRFINAYLISLSATHSYGMSFDSAMEGSSGKLKETADGVSGMEPLEKTKFMEEYFASSLYAMFLRVLDLYANQGGDILHLSGSLLAEVTRVEETNRQNEKTSAKNAVEYLLLWSVSTGIVVFLRFGLSSFFATISHSPVYLGCLAFYFLFMLVSMAIYVSVYTGLPLWTKKKQNERRTKHGKN